MFARVRLITKDVADAVVVPEQALVPQGNEQFVFKVVDNRAVRTKVDVGQRREGKAEIIRGVSPGDVIVTAGHQRLRDGVPVSIRGTAMAPQNPEAEKGAALPTKSGGIAAARPARS